MMEKVKSISVRDGVSVRTALVYDGHLSATVEASGYFNSLINVREILF